MLAIVRKKCQFEGCSKSYNDFRSLVNHWEKTHEVTKDEIKTHWVWSEHLMERKAKRSYSDFSIGIYVSIISLLCCIICNSNCICI